MIVKPPNNEPLPSDPRYRAGEKAASGIFWLSAASSIVTPQRSRSVSSNASEWTSPTGSAGNDAAPASCVADTASRTLRHKPAYFVMIGRSGLEGG